MTAFPASPPFRPGPAAAGADIAGAGSLLAGLLLYTPLLSTTLLAKLSVPPFAAQSLSIAYLFIFLALAVGVVFGQLRLDSRRLSFYLLFVGCIGTVQLVRGEPFSLTSMLFLGLLHLAYVFYLPRQGDSSARALDFFLGLASVVALLGIAQYGLQFVLGPRYAFPIENFVPGEFLIKGFNMQAPIAYGVATYRANGVFLAEPSFFSQLMAVAIVVELLSRNRLWRVLLYGLALVVSHSGTGLLVLAVCGPLLLLLHRRWELLWLALFGLLLAVVLGDLLDLDKLTGRIGEFGAVRSSAYARFIGGFALFDHYLWPDPVKALFGHGPGLFPDYAARLPFPVAEMTLFKMVFEYGLLGAAGYFAFIFYCVFRSPAPVIARLAVALTLLLSGPFIPFFHGLALSLLVWNSAENEGAPQQSPVKPLAAGRA